MIVVDASVAIKWFVSDEPLAVEAGSVLTDIERDPSPYLVPELFMTNCSRCCAGCPGVSQHKYKRRCIWSKRLV